MARTANAPMTSPDATLIARIQRGVNRDRSAPTAVVSTTHHAADPRNTPSVIDRRLAQSSPVTPRPANSAPKERIVIGLVRVRPRIER